MDDKKIRIGVDAQEVETTFSRIRQDAHELAQEMIADAEKRVGTSKEMLKSLEDEIKALERLQHMDVAERRLGVEERLRTATGAERAAAQKELTEIKIDDKEAKIQTELLRDIVDAVLTTGKKEIEEDKKNVLETVSRTPDDRRTFKQRYQAGLLGLEGERGAPDEEQRRQGYFASGLRGYGMAVIGSRNIADVGFNAAQQTGGMMSMMGGTAGIVGIILALLGAVGKQIWEASLPYYRAAAQAYATTGVESNLADARWASQYGISGVEFEQRMSGLARARRSNVGLVEAVQNQILLEKAINLDQGAYADMERLGVLQGRTGMDNVQSGVAALRAGGVVRGGDMSAVPDYLAIMVQLGKEQVSRLGKVDMGVNTKMVAALAGMDETLKKSPEALSTMVNAVYGGLTGARSPQVEALQYSVLKRMRPTASMFELMEMRQDPFSEANQKYLPEYLKQLYGMSAGDKDQFYMNIASQFNLSPQMARKLGTGYLSGEISSMLGKDFKQKLGIIDVEERAAAGKGTAEQEVLSAEWQNAQLVIADNAGKAVNWLEKIWNKIPYHMAGSTPVFHQGYNPGPNQ